jgi:hypothetical protein
LRSWGECFSVGKVKKIIHLLWYGTRAMFVSGSINPGFPSPVVILQSPVDENENGGNLFHILASNSQTTNNQSNGCTESRHVYHGQCQVF